MSDARIELATRLGLELLYFIRADNGLMKIGRTKNLPRRLRDLQAASPLRLNVILVLAGSSEIEAAWHRGYAEHRRHGEWFDLPKGWENDLRHIPQSCWQVAA